MSVLRAENLYRFFHSDADEVIALRSVSLAADAGELVAVVGPSGSGKSTLLSCLGGLDEPDGGAVFVCGERMSHRPEADKSRLRARHVGLVMQSDNLISHLSVRENIVLAARLGGSKADPSALLERLGLAHRALAAPPELSGGEAVRAAVAAAVVKRPAVLLADEPTAEVDGDGEGDVADLLREVAASGTAVVVATHSGRVADRADRVVALRDGAVDG